MHHLTDWEKHGILYVTAHLCDQHDWPDLPDDHVVTLLRRDGYSDQEIADIGTDMETWVERERMPTDLTPPQIKALKIVVEDSDLVQIEREFLPACGRPGQVAECQAGLRALAAKLEARGIEISKISN